MGWKLRFLNLICTVIHLQKLTYYDFAEILISLTTDIVLFSVNALYYGCVDDFSSLQLSSHCACICKPKKVWKIIIAGVLLKDFTTARDALVAIGPCNSSSYLLILAAGLNDIRVGFQGQPLPNPRRVSQTVLSQEEFFSSEYSSYLQSFGQFVDHDITQSPIHIDEAGKPLNCCRIFELSDVSLKMHSGLWSCGPFISTIRYLVLLVPPRLGHLAPASEVVGGHILPFWKGHGLPILK
jgi:hypothetical protein